MRPDFVAERIAHARRCTGTVLTGWNAAELSQCDLWRALLEEAVMDLRAIESYLRPGRVVVPDGLSSALLNLKREIAQIVQIVDAGLAFHRGVALRMGCSAPSYSPRGQIAEDDTTIGLRGMQG
jgi:hypothetical protein